MRAAVRQCSPGVFAHPPGYSDPWWEALRPYTSAYGPGNRDDTRNEVVWSNLVNQRGVRALAEPRGAQYTELTAKLIGIGKASRDNRS